jgi:hypothetical protein
VGIAEADRRSPLSCHEFRAIGNEAVIVPYIDQLLARGREMEVDKGQNLIPNGAVILEELKRRPNTMAALEEKALRTKLACWGCWPIGENCSLRNG